MHNTVCIYNQYSLLIFLSGYLFLKSSLYSWDTESFIYNNCFLLIFNFVFFVPFLCRVPNFPRIVCSTVCPLPFVVVASLCCIKSQYFHCFFFFLTFCSVLLVYWSVSLSLPVYRYYCDLELRLSLWKNESKDNKFFTKVSYLPSNWVQSRPMRIMIF